jgi:hypothetical protein
MMADRQQLETAMQQSLKHGPIGENISATALSGE